MCSRTPCNGSNASQPQTATANRAAAQASVQGRILLAEDVPESSRLICWMLRRAGASIEAVVNGREALQALEQRRLGAEPFQLLLTDMEMPEMDGGELVRTLRSAGDAIPIIVLTAHDGEEHRQNALALGANDHLAKPVDKGRLIAACQALLGGTETCRLLNPSHKAQET